MIAPEIAQKIFDMMVKTKHQRNRKPPGNLDEYGGSGGKTGSAETGWYVDGDRQQHGWYSGFFPVDNPQYALCGIGGKWKIRRGIGRADFQRNWRKYFKITRIERRWNVVECRESLKRVQNGSR